MSSTSSIAPGSLFVFYYCLLHTENLSEREHGNIICFQWLGAFIYSVVPGGSKNLQNIRKRNYRLNKEPDRENSSKSAEATSLRSGRPRFLSFIQHI